MGPIIGHGAITPNKINIAQPLTWCYIWYIIKNLEEYVLVSTTLPATHKILADETVSVSDLKKSPSQYFTDHAIAVLSNNRPTGYVIGATAYEALVSLLQQCQSVKTFPGDFQPTAERMKQITEKGMELLAHASPEKLEQLGEFTE